MISFLKNLETKTILRFADDRLIEESDYKHAKELFGTTSSSKEAKSLDEMLPKSEADFVEYAELLASRAVHFEVRFRSATSIHALTNAVYVASLPLELLYPSIMFCVFIRVVRM